MRAGAVALVCWLSVAAVARAAATKRVRYHGYSVVVPSGWPVYRLAEHPRVCVRFDRHAVYLGRPGHDQACPAHAAGRTEAILVEPLRSADRARPASLRLTRRAAGVVVTATWSRDPGVVRRALGVRSLTTTAANTSVVGPADTSRRTAPTARAAAVRAQAGAVYTGLGFDACSAPSLTRMAAWGSSPYRAIGVYIGGANMACSQSNLTPSWVSQQTAAGWHLIPTYVGLQAPTNSCGCAAISPGSATAQGATAAADAVQQAQATGIGPGNPIYFDMEAYPRGGTNTAAVLAFLESWTTQLHASGYTSGVYSSADSGIRDLVAQLGTGYQEPDDLWIARWNNAKNTSDPNVPSTAWASHQRLHQYSGAHNETYGGVTLNIDGDYVDGATAGSGGGTIPPPVAAVPSLSVLPSADGGIALRPSWGGVSGISSWQVIAGPSSTALTPAADPVSASVRAPITIHSAFPYFAVQAIGSAGQILGTSAPVATPAHVAIFGKSVFVSSRGTAGVPVGCFNSAPCHVTTTIFAGRTVIAATGSEQIPVGGGLAFFTLTASGRTRLARAHGRRLAVNVSIRDASGLRATRRLTLIPFSTSGAGPRRSAIQSADVWLIGTTDFVSRGWVGGILAACVSSAPCHPSVTISARGQTIARTGSQFLGVGQLGYLFFSLTSAGHQMLVGTRGNQLPATVTIGSGASAAVANIALVSFR